jgi:hypothetical protein
VVGNGSSWLFFRMGFDACGLHSLPVRIGGLQPECHSFKASTVSPAPRKKGIDTGGGVEYEGEAFCRRGRKRACALSTRCSENLITDPRLWGGAWA